MTGAKILVVGMANSGKTSLLKSLKDAMVVSRDGKPFPFEMPHFNVPEYGSMDELLDMVYSKIEAYKKKYKGLPKTIAFDSVSRIFTDVENNCNKRFNGFEVWTNVNKEINAFVQNINDMVAEGVNVVLIAHVTWDEKSGKFIETCKGSFAKTGGFMSTVDYAINIDVTNGKYWVTHRGNGLSRTLLMDMPNKQPVDEFSLQDYIDKIADKASNVTEKWSL